MQRIFFSAYFLALFSDWLKGAYIYALYSSYGYPQSQIALLYIAGFASSGLFGTFTGCLADSLGRRNMALVFTLVYALSALCKVRSDFLMLLMGRVLGGLATSLLCSTFESWYVQQHLITHNFPPVWLAGTFSRVTFYNGLLAITAGLLSSFLAETLQLGPLAPFLAAIPLLGLCALTIALTWDQDDTSTNTDHHSSWVHHHIFILQTHIF